MVTLEIYSKGAIVTACAHPSAWSTLLVGYATTLHQKVPACDECIFRTTLIHKLSFQVRNCLADAHCPSSRLYVCVTCIHIHTVRHACVHIQLEHSCCDLFVVCLCSWGTRLGKISLPQYFSLSSYTVGLPS